MASYRFAPRRIVVFAGGLLCLGSVASSAWGTDYGCTAPPCGQRYQAGPQSLPPAPGIPGETMPTVIGADDNQADVMLPPDAQLDMMDPQQQPPDRDLAAPVPPSSLLAASFGASAGGFSSAPNTIGDFFGGGLNLGFNFAFEPSFNTGMNNDGHQHQDLATAPIHGGDRLLKITEFNSPIPVDRIFFTYNHFHNAIQESIDGTVVDRNLDRVVAGLEKTFNNGNSSIELRLPFADGLDAVQNTSDSISEQAVLFGDIALSLKTILLTTDRTIYTGGLGITVPTGPDGEFTFFGETLFVENEAVHVSPYLGALHLPNDRCFLQGFLQFNFDVNGNAYSTTTGDSGVIQEQTLMFLSGTIGYWIYRNPRSGNYLTGIAPVLELHYTSTLTDADTDGEGGANIIVNDGANRIDILNLTAGTHFQLGPMSTLTAAVVVPLGEGENKLFDAEVSVLFNRRF